MPAVIPDSHRDLLSREKKAFAHLSMVTKDGEPRVWPMWFDYDGEHVIINTVQGYVKLRNIGHDPRVAVAVSDPEDPTRYVQIRGRVVDVTTEGGAEHIEKLARKYTGEPYAWYGGRDQVRTIVTIAPEHMSGMG